MWKQVSSLDVVQTFRRVLLTALALSAVSTLIESVAGVAGRTRLIDLTGVLIERPLWIILFGLWATWIVRRLFTDSWSTAIERVVRFAPLVLLIPLINSAVAWLGLESTVPAFVNVLEAPVSLLTFGWLPRLLASPGVLVFLPVAGLVLAFQAWSVRQAPQRILGWGVLWLLGGFGLLLFPSLFSWAIVSSQVSPLNAGPNVLARTWVALSQEGYWWRSVSDRFPGILEGEAEASVRLLRLVLAWLVLLGAGLVVFFRHSTVSVRKMLGWFKPTRGISFLTAALFGLLIGRAYNGQLFVRAIDGIAFLLFCVALSAAWIVSVCRNDLHDLEGDTLAERVDRPLVSREASLSDLTWLSKASLLGLGVSGWLLGWPVFLPLVGFLFLQEVLAAPGLRWKERPYGALILALSFVCVATSGIFFTLRSAAIPLLPASIWLTVALFYVIHSLPKAFRWFPQLLTWLATRIHLSPRLFIPIALALGYLLVPLLSGWTVLWWIALPCAIVALLPLLGGGRWDERKIVGWQTAFLIIAFLLLSVRPSP